MRPLQEKNDAINKLEAPTTKKQIQASIEMIEIYRNFISNFAEILAILTDFTKRNLPNKVSWTNIHVKAFGCLLSALSSYPILQNPDLSKEFVLQMDACDRGTGVVFLQSDCEKLHPIVFMSRKLLPIEQIYSIVEKECLAIVKP